MSKEYLESVSLAMCLLKTMCRDTRYVGHVSVPVVRMELTTDRGSLKTQSSCLAKDGSVKKHPNRDNEKVTETIVSLDGVGGCLASHLS